MADHRDSPFIAIDRSSDSIPAFVLGTEPFAPVDVPMNNREITAPTFTGEATFNDVVWPAWEPPPVGPGDLFLVLI